MVATRPALRLLGKTRPRAWEAGPPSRNQEVRGGNSFGTKAWGLAAAVSTAQDTDEPQLRQRFPAPPRYEKQRAVELS